MLFRVLVLRVAIVSAAGGSLFSKRRHFLRLDYHNMPSNPEVDAIPYQDIYCEAPDHEPLTWYNHVGRTSKLQNFVVWTADAPRGVKAASISCAVITGGLPEQTVCAVSMANQDAKCDISHKSFNGQLKLVLSVVPGKNVGPPAVDPPPVALTFKKAGWRYNIARFVVHITAYNGGDGAPYWRLDCQGPEFRPSLSVEITKKVWQEVAKVAYMWPVVYTPDEGYHPGLHFCTLKPFGKGFENEKGCKVLGPPSEEVCCTLMDHGLNAVIRVEAR